MLELSRAFRQTVGVRAWAVALSKSDSPERENAGSSEPTSSVILWRREGADCFGRGFL